MRQPIAVASLFFLSTVSLFAQTAGRARSSAEGYAVASPLVTAATSGNRVRFTALALTQKIRLEVVSQTGEPVYDSGYQPGNRLEWLVQNQRGAELGAGLYGCIITVADLLGEVTHRTAVFRVKGGAVSFESTDAVPRAAASDGQESITVLRAEASPPFTLVSHDGTEGWIESASGGLSFHAGSLTRDRNSAAQMRLTADGSLGIGVSEPQARLDVAGLIRTSEGFQFSDGTVLRMEAGVPVLVKDTSAVGSNGTTGGVDLAAAKRADIKVGGVSVGVLAVDGGPGRVLGSEGGTPYYNTLYGLLAGAGLSTSTGTNNAFFGWSAGTSTSTGQQNAFFGWSAGASNTIANYNSFFGSRAGYTNTTGEGNSFFGDNAGILNTTGGANSFFGLNAGYHNTTGVQNSFFGSSSGTSNTTGNYNCFFGDGSGSSNTIGYANVFMGQDSGVNNTSGYWNTFLGDSAGQENITGYQNTLVGRYAGVANTTGVSNTILGNSAGLSNTAENNNTFVGAESDGSAGITNASALGYKAKVAQSNSLVLGSINGVNSATADTKVGIGTTAPGAKLDIVGFWGAPGSSIPTNWALRTSGRRGVVNGNSGFYEDVFGSYAELSTYKWDDGTTLPLALNANGGNVGIGTTAPGATLDVIGLYGPPGASIPSGWANRVTGRRGVVNGNRGFYEDIIVGSNTYAELSTYKWDDGTTLPLVFNANGGNVGIGTTNPQKRLHVIGDIIASGTITANVTSPEEELPDYVFESDYRLMPVEELERFLAKEKHLPNIPPASEIKANGLNLGEFQMKLLEKIEELTLYTVQQAKTIGQKDAEIKALRSEKDAEIAALSSRLSVLEQVLERLSRQEQK